ncbi:heavy metal translocating P-type ATPase [Desulforhopalus sp. 52FAK]
MKKYQSEITGMHCAACSSRIEKVVGNLEGVASCAVNLATARASIDYDDTVVTVQAIEASIKKIGFEAVGESREPSNSDENRVEQQLEEVGKRLFPAFILAACIMYVSMGPMIGLPLPGAMSASSGPFLHAFIQFLLVLPVLYLGRHFYLSGIPALLRGGPNMDSLIAIGTGAAFLYSTWNLVEITMGIRPVELAHDLYFESAAMLIALISLGKYLEMRSKVKTGEAIGALMQLTPETATCIDAEGKHQRTQVDLLQVGDNIFIRPGERIPVDGVIVEGESYIDESMLTGESIPVKKTEGTHVYGGTLNTTGTLTFTAAKVGAETVLARIVTLVQEAQGSKAAIASLADRISLYFVPVVMFIAIASGLIWYFGAGADFSFSLRTAIAVLVIACPCAMGLATPTSIMVGTGRGAQLGILIKNGEVLERAEGIDCVVFDKTGTLTRGKPQLTDIVHFSSLTDDDLLSVAAGIEQFSEHPLAGAIVMAAQEKGLHMSAVEDFKALPGYGVQAHLMMEGRLKQLLLGNASLLLQQGVNDFPEDYADNFKRLSLEGKTVIHLAIDGTIQGLMAVTDPIKNEAREAVAGLQDMGVEVVMLTGDNEQTAEVIANIAGISHVVAGLFPEDKSDEIKRLKEKGRTVAMVGDGINDAPALAVADVGMAMGTGIDIAMESADIVLMNGNLEGVEKAIGLSRATMRNIRQNLFWAFIYNVIGIPVAAGVLILVGGPALSPMLGGAAMALSSVSVVSNALRLRYYGVAK